MAEILKSLLRWLMSLFGLKAPEQLPDPKIPTDPIPPTTSPASPPQTPAVKQRRFLRLVTTGQVDNDGIRKLALMLCENVDGKKFRIVEAVTARSGLAFHQFFRVGSQSVGGSSEPLPEGYWSVGAVEWAGVKGDYNARFDSGVGPVWIGLEPKMTTQRAAIGIHWDLGVPGTAGCCGIPERKDLEVVVSWFADPATAPQALTVNWGLGTVETWMNEPAPTIPALSLKPDEDYTNQCTNRTSPRELKIDTIVVHNTEGSMQSAIDRFLNPSEQVSAHLIIGRDGKVVKMVNFVDAAWHAGNRPINQKSLGMEIVAGADQGEGMTPIQETLVISWLKFWMRAYGVSLENILPHRKCVSTSCPGSIWKTDADLETWKKKNLT